MARVGQGTSRGCRVQEGVVKRQRGCTVGRFHSRAKWCPAGRNSKVFVQEPRRSAVSSFQISGRYKVYRQTSTPAVQRGGARRVKSKRGKFLFDSRLSGLSVSPFFAIVPTSLLFSFSTNPCLASARVIFLSICTSIIPSSSFLPFFFPTPTYVPTAAASARDSSKGVNGLSRLGPTGN